MSQVQTPKCSMPACPYAATNRCIDCKKVICVAHSNDVGPMGYRCDTCQTSLESRQRSSAATANLISIAVPGVVALVTLLWLLSSGRDVAVVFVGAGIAGAIAFVITAGMLSN